MGNDLLVHLFTKGTYKSEFSFELILSAALLQFIAETSN